MSYYKSYFGLLPIDLRREIIHCTDYTSLWYFICDAHNSLINVKLQQFSAHVIPELAQCATEVLWKSIWHSFFSNKKYSDIYVCGCNSYKEQCMLVLSHFNQYSQGIISYTEYVSCLVKAGCEKYIAPYYEQLRYLQRPDLMKLLANSCNVELIKNYIDVGYMSNFDLSFHLMQILYELLNINRHKCEIMEILKYCWKYIFPTVIPDTIAQYNLLQLINKNCLSVEDFYYFFRNITNKDLEWVFNNENCCVMPISNMFEHAINYDNRVILNILFENISPSTDMTQILCKSLSYRNTDVFYRLLKVADYGLINWSSILGVSVYANNIDIVKLACENGADGKQDNFFCIRLAIEHKYAEIAKYLWEKFPLE